VIFYELHVCQLFVGRDLLNRYLYFSLDHKISKDINK